MMSRRHREPGVLIHTTRADDLTAIRHVAAERRQHQIVVIDHHEHSTYTLRQEDFKPEQDPDTREDPKFERRPAHDLSPPSSPQRGDSELWTTGPGTADAAPAQSGRGRQASLRSVATRSHPARTSAPPRPRPARRPCHSAPHRPAG